MTAYTQEKRTKTAKELAEHFGVCERTIRNVMAEPREDYVKRSEEKLNTVVKLRLQGLSIKEIAEKSDIPFSSIGSYIAKARKTGKLPPKAI